MNDNIKDFQIFGITGYTVMSNYHLQDRNLSIKAKGLLSLMLSLPKTWDYSINGLVTLSKDGRDSIKNTLNELKQAEYIQIEEHREPNGHFKYKYSVYYLPYPKWLEMSKLTEGGFTASVEPSSVNPKEEKNNIIKNNNKKDKIDKTQDLSMPCEEIKHNIVTKELIRREYISEDDSSSFLFDDLFNQLMEEGHNYKDLLIMSNYIVSRIKDRHFKDENNNDIQNRYGYFKYALISNINRFENMPDELFSPDDFFDDYDWLNDPEDEEDLEL
ncbi:MAG: hypothetical protein J5892_05060 [Bacilli bacterium]|nr:hypothetical protein [Bacilli bacterium]